MEVEGGEVCDSDGEVVGRERATFAMFEFITVLTESSRLQRLLPPILPELVYLLITHMQITEDQVSGGGILCEQENNTVRVPLPFSPFSPLLSLLRLLSLLFLLHPGAYVAG